jgi:uncharacterized protein (DUF427 family)
MSKQALEDLDVSSTPRLYPTGEIVHTMPWPRRVRGRLGHDVIVDSTRTLLQLEQRHLPVWYFPRDDVRTQLLQPSSKRTTCPHKGTASYWNIVVDGRTVPNAVWSYDDPVEGRDDLRGCMAFYWDRVDAWFEEDDEVFVHPRSPFHRVDVLNSSRHVRVELDGVVLGETRRPRLLFETGLPVRYYLPRADVNEDLLEHSDTTSQCPYKGVATYYSARVGDRVVPDLAWSYPYPIPECPKVEGLFAFFNEHTDVWVDGELQPRPDTPWSRSRTI